MGLRFSFGVGPIRFSAPLFGRRRKKKSSKYFYGQIKNDKGKRIWKCPHRHSRLDLAEACSTRERRRRAAG